jgi:hypothetical protein
MLPFTLAFYLVAQVSMTPPLTVPKVEKLMEKNCGTRASWDVDSQSCRALPPTKERCWADGQQLDTNLRVCVPVSLTAFCAERNWDYEQEQTVSRILNDLNAHDCDEAQTILQKTRRLSLRSAGFLKVQDLRPLRALPFIEELNLDGQRVSDLTPLQKLSHLKKLSIRNNDVYDLEPLLSLSQLETLDLTGNPVTLNDPILKKLQKKVKVTLSAMPAPAAPQEDLESADSTGLVAPD